MTVRELAARIGIDSSTAYRYLRAGKLPGIQIGSQWVIDRSRVERFLAGHEDAAGNPLIQVPIAPTTAPLELTTPDIAIAWLRGLHATLELLLKAAEAQVHDPCSDESSG